MALTEPTEDQRLDVTETQPHEWVGVGAPAPRVFDHEPGASPVVQTGV